MRCQPLKAPLKSYHAVSEVWQSIGLGLLLGCCSSTAVTRVVQRGGEHMPSAATPSAETPRPSRLTPRSPFSNGIPSRSGASANPQPNISTVRLQCYGLWLRWSLQPAAVRAALAGLGTGSI